MSGMEGCVLQVSDMNSPDLPPDVDSVQQNKACSFVLKIWVHFCYRGGSAAELYIIGS